MRLENKLSRPVFRAIKIEDADVKNSDSLFYKAICILEENQIMKIFTLVIIQILFFSQFITAQRKAPMKNDQYDYFMKKRNTLNTVGWLSLSAGVTMMLLGGLEIVADGVGNSSRYRNDNKLHGSGVAVAGEIIALASIPLFIIAHKNKKKASLALKEERAFSIDHMFHNPYTALALKIKL